MLRIWFGPNPVPSPRPVRLRIKLATWRSGYAAACKAVYTGSIPVVALENPCKLASFGRDAAQTIVYSPKASQRAVYAARFLWPFAGDLSGDRLVDSGAGQKPLTVAIWARDREPYVNGHARLSSDAKECGGIPGVLASESKRTYSATSGSRPAINNVRWSRSLAAAGGRAAHVFNAPHEGS
jgi:hypothetical protein